MMGAILIVVVGLLLSHSIECNPITTPEPPAPSSPVPEKVENRSISDIVIQQTETVKKIVSDQVKQQEYPVITKFDADYKDNVKKDLDKLTLEELRVKCQHFSKFFNNTLRLQDTKPTVHKTDYQIGYRPMIFEQQKRRPVYVAPTSYTNKYVTRPGFYITTHGTTTPKPVATTPATVGTNVKYIRLEPVILQKTILSDGRTVYYWHKSLPSAVAYAQPTTVTQAPGLSMVDEDIVETTEPQTTTTYYNRYDFRNFFAFYRSPTTTEKPTTTTLSTTTSTTTTTTPTPKPLTGPVFQNQLRFVVPVPYDGANGAPVKTSWGFDEFAYYPKDLQPSTMNVQVPYSPTFHVINALAVPNKYANEQNLKEDAVDERVTV